MFDEQVCGASRVRAVRGTVAEVVVVHMASLEIIGRGVSCVSRIEEVVVDGDLRSNVGGPADSERFVVL